tara:strand:- start:205 stop:591 length:387 start_codon:yes stop_codon:yes gene_type:complete
MAMNIWYSTGECRELSNLALRPFTDDAGNKYQSVEHAYQSWKGGSFDATTYNKKWDKAGTKHIGKLGTKTKGNWNITLMGKIMEKSFQQNPKSHKALRATKGTTLTHTQDRGVWKTQFPKILMQIRNS